MISAIDPHSNYIILPNYEKLKLPTNLRFIFLASDTSKLTPAEVSRLGTFHVNSDYDWPDYIAKELPQLFERVSVPSIQSQQKLTDNINKFLLSLFSLKSPAFARVLDVSNLELIKNFTITLERLLDRFFSTFYEPDDHKSKLDLYLSHILFVSIGFGIGSLVQSQDRNKFDVICKDYLSSLPMHDKSAILNKTINFKTWLAEYC